MVELPSFARRSLRQEKALSTHPDASLLTGFVEQALPRAMRTQVIEHLADCSSCRTLVFLATPETSHAVVPQKSFGWHLPRFQFGYRWATGLATVAIVASSVFVMHNRQTPNATPQNVVSTPSVAPTVAPAVTATQPQVAVARVHANRPAAAKPADSEVAANAAKTNELPEAYNTREMFQTSVDLNQPAMPGVVSPELRPKESPVRWMVSGPGLLYQSSNKGLSWQSVDIGNGVVFAAVAAVGQQVWAGGKAGAFFKSDDGGRTWKPVTDSGVENDDVQQIEFRDAMNGTVTTTRGVLVTNDGGQSWHWQ